MMYGTRIVATLTIEGSSPYSQSRPHGEPELEGEGKDDYDARTWREHMHVEGGAVRIPAKAIMDALTDAASYLGDKIKGAGQKTWTSKFRAGIAVLENPSLGITPDQASMIKIYAHASGKRGSGTRVHRRFPIFNEWSATFEVHILDPIITEDQFRKVVETAGLFIGIGRYKPQNGGTNGRFTLEKLDWKEDRVAEAA